MMYSRYAIVAALFVALAAGCDSEKGASTEDAGPETTNEGAKTQKKQRQKKAKEKARPQARASESGTLHEKPPLQIEGLLEAGDLEKVAGSGAFEPTELPGRDPSPNYNALRLRPEEGGGYGAGAQLWAFESPGAAEKRLTEFRSQYLNTKDLQKGAQKELGSGAFASKRGGIRNLVFSVDEPPRVVAVSCSVETCESNESLLKLAVEVGNRIRAAGGAEAGSSDGEKGSGDDEKGGG